MAAECRFLRNIHSAFFYGLIMNSKNYEIELPFNAFYVKILKDFYVLWYSASNLHQRKNKDASWE